MQLGTQFMSFGTSGPKDQYEKLSLFGVQDKKFGASGFNPLLEFNIKKGSLTDPEKTLNAIKNLVFPKKQYHKVGPRVRFAEVVLNGLSDDLRKDPDFIAQVAMAIPKRYPQLKVQIRRAKYREDMPGSTLEALKRNEEVWVMTLWALTTK